MSIARAILRTRCGCEREMTITLPAPPLIELPLRPAREFYSPFPGCTTPEAPVPTMGRRVFERAPTASDRSLAQLYYEVYSWEAQP
jgi:hypothetical protein